MQIHYSKFRILLAAGLVFLLAGCISSPFPGGTVGSLYQWNDLETPVVTTLGINNPTRNGFFDGDFDLTDLPVTNPELTSDADAPWLFEACDETQCQSLVLFSNDFKQDSLGMLTGNVSMNALTTLMANEVRGQPAGTVRAMLERLSSELRFEGDMSYATFIGLDLIRDEDSRDHLLYPDLYDEAVVLLSEQPMATVQDLLGESIAKTTDLEASSEFAFDSSWQLRVDVDLPALRESGAYLLLCNDFETSENLIEVNYASCPLKAPLQAGAWQGEVQLTGGVQSMAAVIMPLQNPNDPQVVLWEREFDGDQLVLRP